MKRFYRAVRVESGADGHGILLDDRSVLTPARARLRAPTPALAVAIAQEWEAQGERVEPRSMPLTGLANAALDRVAPDRDAFAAGLARYGESDLLCYRADRPAKLVARQAEQWDPLLAWARRRYDIDFEVVSGIMHRPQSAHTVSQLAHAVAARDPFQLAGLSPLVTVSGSLVLALALAEGAVDFEAAWAAAALDDLWQVEQWGTDAEAEKALAARRADFEAGHRFLQLLT